MILGVTVQTTVQMATSHNAGAGGWLATTFTAPIEERQ
jgi:hypothetical protein